MTPKSIKKSPNGELQLLWSDGSSAILAADLLRRSCPCAECREQRGDTSHAKPIQGQPRSGARPKGSALRVLSSTLEEELTLEKIWPVGNYAVGLLWKDGHDSGIYTFGYLHELANSQAPKLREINLEK